MDVQRSAAGKAESDLLVHWIPGSSECYPFSLRTWTSSSSPDPRRPLPRTVCETVGAKGPLGKSWNLNPVFTNFVYHDLSLVYPTFLFEISLSWQSCQSSFSRFVSLEIVCPWKKEGILSHSFPRSSAISLVQLTFSQFGKLLLSLFVL